MSLHASPGVLRGQGYSLHLLLLSPWPLRPLVLEPSFASHRVARAPATSLSPVEVGVGVWVAREGAKAPHRGQPGPSPPGCSGHCCAVLTLLRSLRCSVMEGLIETRGFPARR